MASPRLPVPSASLTRRIALGLLALVLAGVVVYALSQLNLGRIGHALITATPGWIAAALALMALAMLSRAVSWLQALRAALPDTHIPWPAVIRATMIGVMASAVFPGRIGEPTRIVVLSRRLEGAQRRLLPIVTGTVFSQTLINLLALAILASVTFSSIPLGHGKAGAILGVAAIPLALCLLVLIGPRLLRLGARSPWLRVRLASAAIARLLRLARQGLVVFVTPRHGFASVACQLLAWALQWLACYTVILALGLPAHPAPIAAAAVLLAVNVSAILPATPSNVGVFQAACLVVLVAYGVGAGQAIAYGIVLQAVEVLTALMLGVPALLGEGMTWRDIRPHEAATGVGASTGTSGTTDTRGTGDTKGTDMTDEVDQTGRDTSKTSETGQTRERSLPGERP